MASKVTKMSNVAVAMQSALGAEKVITAVTKADPGVFTSAAHGFANGTYIALAMQGMYQFDGRVFRVLAVAADTFQLEDVDGTGVDTTGLDDFASGTARAITFGTSITSATSMDASGGDFDFIDTTTIHSNVKSQIPGSANPITKSFNNIWDVSDAGQIAMKNASDRQEQRAFRFTYGVGGTIEVFLGYVGFTGAPTGAAQDKITTPATVTAFGTPTYYAS